MTINEIQNEIVKEFETVTEWDDKYARLIKFGRDLAPFQKNLEPTKTKLKVANRKFG